MNGISYLDMKEVAERLKMKSVDAAARWCIDNNVDIMTLGNKRVVSEFAFSLVFERPIVEMLKQKYPKDWMAYYDAYRNTDFKKYFEMESSITVVTHTTNRFDTDTFLKEIGYGKSKN